MYRDRNPRGDRASPIGAGVGNFILDQRRAKQTQVPQSGVTTTVPLGGEIRAARPARVCRRHERDRRPA